MAETLIIVAGKSSNMLEAAQIGGFLKSKNRIQRVTTSPEKPSVDLMLWPDGGGYVKDSGGYASYRAGIVEHFVKAGFKLYEPPKPEPEVAKPVARKSEEPKPDHVLPK